MAAKLSDAEIYYIEQNPESLSDNDLAKKMGRSVTIIKKIIAKKKPKVEPVVESAPQVEQPKTEEKPIKPMRRAFGHIRKNGNSLATIMTPAASELGDDSRKQGKHKLPFSEQHKDYVFKPYGDDPRE